MGVPALIGAGIGGGLGLLKGQGVGGLLKGAALGGAGGALGGGVSNLMSTGSLMGANTAGAAATAGNAASSAIPGTIESSGLVFNPSTGTYLNPEYYAGASSPLATYTGGEGLFSNAMSNIGSSMPQTIKDYATPQNLLGVAQLSQDNKAPMQMHPVSGNVSRGNIPEFKPYNTGILIRRN